MERSSKRGKIPQSDWPLIMARYEAGETLSSIARTYDCSPPAISYVVSRSRARQPSGETPRPTPTGESQLIKAAADGTGNRDSAAVPPGEPTPVYPAMTGRPPEAPPVHASPPVSQSPVSQGSAAEDRRFEIRPGNSNGFGRPTVGEREVSASNLFAPSAPPPRQNDPQPPYRPAPQAAANGDQRGRLHLSLGNGSHGNGGSQPEPR